MRISVVFALVFALIEPAAARTGSGHHVPTANNFCGSQEMVIPVTLCNDENEYQVVTVGMNSGTFVGCGTTFEPSYTSQPVGYGLAPGECATVEITLQRPSILDTEPEACVWITINEDPGPAVWLGILVYDSPVLPLCVGWNFYEAEWARFIHPLDPVTQQIQLRNLGQDVQDLLYEIRVLGDDGADLTQHFSLNNQEPGLPIQDFAYIEPLGNTEIAFEMKLMNPDLPGPFEMVLMADRNYDGDAEPLSSIPVLNSLLFTQGGGGGGLVAAPAAIGSRLRLALSPNPFNPSTRLSFELQRESSVRAEVLDLRGRVVRVLMAGQRLAAGTHQMVWNGRDDRGAAVASGVYYMRVEAGGEVAMLKAALLK